MIPDSDEHLASRPQRAARTNLFAMATVYADSGSMPVKVRNLSSTGARIEGSFLPAPGSQIRMRRGSLETAGEVVWCRDGAAGIRFVSDIAVADWLPRGRAIAPQQQIDEVVHQARFSSAVASPVAPLCVPDSQPTSLELMRLKRAIESLAEDLANDPGVMERHGLKLQMLDIAAGTLRKLATQA